MIVFNRTRDSYFLMISPALLKWLKYNWGWLFTLIVAVASTFSRFRFGNDFLSFYEDDFFYYLQVARNVATHGKSTFDGIHLTNGYHPLWLLTLAGIYSKFPGKHFFYVLESLTVISVLATYNLSKQCLLRYTSDTEFVTLVSAVVAFLALILARGGMETTLTIPLILLFVSYRLRPAFGWSWPNMLIFGFIGSLVVLSRLDTVILVVLMFIFDGVVHRFSLKQWAIRGTGYLVGAWLIGLYVVVNQNLFGTISPISGQAKQMRLHHFPSYIPILSIIWPIAVNKILIVLPALVFGVVAIFLLFRQMRMKIGNKSLQSVALVFLAFPLFFYSIISILSDWSLWLWYLYPFVLLIFGYAIMHIDFHSLSPMRDAKIYWRRNYFVSGFIICGLAYTFVFAIARKPTDFYLQSRQLAEFASTHPGTYAMGDRSGMLGFLISDPVIQLEGLMMDKQFLHSIYSGKKLAEVFKEYGVQYYIATDPPHQNGCYIVVEPRQAGPDSPKMHGLICKDPMARFIRSGIEEDIFDVRLR